MFGFRYRKAKKLIFDYVKSYKRLCTGNNRFVVTVPVLQDVFREFNTDVIEKVWRDLVIEKIIQEDPMDGEWCIRKTDSGL
jgi:hypothetical protein